MDREREKERGDGVERERVEKERLSSQRQNLPHCKMPDCPSAKPSGLRSSD